MTSLAEYLQTELDGLKDVGLYKSERVITSKQAGTVTLSSGQSVINLCANNYLGLSDNAELIAAGQAALERYGYGMSSVRFICGTQEVHTALEARISDFLGFEDTILYSSCFDANTGLFETILGPEDAIISDALNHASIIDGVRLCKAARYRYANSDMADLETKLKEAAGARFRLIATDGVFSMDGYIAKLGQICDLAERYDAMVMVDESHAVGFVGATGRGSIEHCGVMDRVDIVTGTLGKALGGASGGYTSGKREVIDWLRQRSRPYLFSNTLAPVIAATSIKVLDMLEGSTERRDRLMANAAHFRDRMGAAGFDLLPGEHPIIPVMLRDPKLAQDMAKRLDAKGVYVAPFSFPVVPRGQDRIRTQMSAAHSTEVLDGAIDAFIEVGHDMGIPVMKNEMKAIVKAKPEEGLWMKHVPVPEPGPDEVLIKVKKSAICGTDVHIWKWDEWSARTVPVPMVVGHEFCGEIVDCGKAATKYQIGQRVAGEGHVVCNTCRNCRAGRGHLCRNTLGVGVNRPGSFAEYLSLPETNVIPIPDDIPDEIAAVFDPFGNAVHTALSFDLVGEDVLVTGAGPIGIMGALVAQKVGARKVVITDISPYRRDLARNLGVQHVVNAATEDLNEVMAEIGMTEGFDVGLEMSGAAPAMRDMIDKMNNGGKIALLGIAPTDFSVDWNQIIFKMLTVKGIYGREMYETWYKMIALVQSGLDVSGLITHRIGIDDFEDGFAAMLSGEAGKVVMDWG